MCTLTWQLQPQGYLLLFNRDELRTRKQALRPRIFPGKPQIIAPVDGDAGGTWVAVNEFGVATCLLNYYPPGASLDREGKRSRGLLVLDLAVCLNYEQLLNQLEHLEFAQYLPFRMFQFYKNQTVFNLTWDGETLKRGFVDERSLPHSGSSFRNDEVVEARCKTFQRLVSQDTSSPERLSHLLNFHCYHDPNRGAHSVNMERSDARTVSFSKIEVNDQLVSFNYQAKLNNSIEFGENHGCTLPLSHG